MFERYDIELKLVRITLDYEGKFYCIDNKGEVWAIQEHEIQKWK